MDIGANVGWFTFALANRGIHVVAIERHPRHYRTLLYLAKRLKADNVTVMVAELNLVTSPLLPRTDCVLFLSVWHHIVRELGLTAATEILATLWEHTNQVLFFETGERELDPKFGLPTMDPNSLSWLTSYLGRTCSTGRVVCLGTHLVPEGCGAMNERHLFAVTR